VVVAYGFRLFLLSDIVLFSCLFAAHAVLQSATADGPAGHELFKPTNIAIETACLLLSADQLNPALVLVHEHHASLKPWQAITRPVLWRR
jgi:heme/copper-type cytochrome/quinol oxidase subunit 3